MELFVRFRDEKDVPLLLTKKEVEQINTRLEFSHTIRVFGSDASRPLYLMPKEYDRARRRFETYGDDKLHLLNVEKSASWDHVLHAVKNNADGVVIALLAGCAIGLWYLGGGKTPAFAYAVFNPGEGSPGRLALPMVVVALAALGAFGYFRLRRRGTVVVR